MNGVMIRNPSLGSELKFSIRRMISIYDSSRVLCTCQCRSVGPKSEGRKLLKLISFCNDFFVLIEHLYKIKLFVLWFWSTILDQHTFKYTHFFKLYIKKKIGLNVNIIFHVYVSPLIRDIPIYIFDSKWRRLIADIHYFKFFWSKFPADGDLSISDMCVICVIQFCTRQAEL